MYRYHKFHTRVFWCANFVCFLLESVFSKTLPGGGGLRTLQDRHQEYEIRTSANIANEIKRWADHYPDFVALTTAQDEYGLATAGTENDCLFDPQVEGCLNYILTIQDFNAHPEGSESSNKLPEVFWSGEVHGNERIGPTAVVEAAHLLLDAAECISHPDVRVKSKGNEKAWNIELKKARDCRDDFRKIFGISESEIGWLARLVQTRRIVIVPTANALGYDRNERTEDSIDPNRDFPYVPLGNDKCMQTIAARTINELFRDHMFQLALTFHAGTEVIGYEWGTEPYNHFFSPDDTAQVDIAKSYQYFAGRFPGTPDYTVGDMNTEVYPVEGGMEDWAYAGSWDTSLLHQCTPAKYGGYPTNKTLYDDATLRAFNMLIETSDEKTPAKSTLGNSKDLLDPSSEGNGHVARNIRLALTSAELVEPYASITKVNDLRLSDDIIPKMQQLERNCQDSKLVAVPKNSDTVEIEWIVGGSVHVDTTRIVYTKWDDFAVSELNCEKSPAMDIIAKMQEGTMLTASSGKGKAAVRGGDNFSAQINVAHFNPHDRIAVFAVARVDQNWTTQPDEHVKPDVPPQSHMVNVRTNSSWYYEKNGKIVQGKLDWVSIPLTILIGDYVDKAGHQGNKAMKTVELSNRFGVGGGATPTPSDTAKATRSGLSGAATFLIFVCFAVAAFLGGRLYLRQKIRRANRERIREFIEDEDAPTPGLATKEYEKRKKKSKRYNHAPNDPGTNDLELSENNDTGVVEMGEFS